MKAKRRSVFFTTLCTMIALFFTFAGAQAVEITGSVESADTPETPVAGAMVSIPSLDISATTNANGEFTLGDIAEGIYTVTVTFDPAGSSGYHNQTFAGITVSASPLELAIKEILPPVNINASAGDRTIALYWSEPANHEEPSGDAIEGQLEGLRYMRSNLNQRLEPAFADSKNPSVQAMEREIDRDIHRLTVLSNPDWVTESIDDLVGYRLRVDGDILPDVFAGTQYVMKGLENGVLHSIEIAADYGYGDETLVFSTPIELRAHPQEYQYTEVEFDWIEIRPSEGGTGTPVSWRNVYHPVTGAELSWESGFIDLGPLTYEHYGVEYSQMNISERGWLSFTFSGWEGVRESTLLANVPYFIPDEKNSPYNCIIPYSHATPDVGVGADFNVWYLIDEENERIVVEWFTGDLISRNRFVTLFQAILDCRTNSVTFQYNYAERIMSPLEPPEHIWFQRIEPRRGIENIDGSEGLSIGPWDSIADSTAYLISPIDVHYGNITGTITDENGPVEDAYVTTVGLSHGAYSDENGNYTLRNVDRDATSHTIIVRATGYQEKRVDEVQFTDPGSYDHSLDVEIEHVGVETPPSILGYHGNQDDGAYVYIAPPGTYSDLKYFQYDDGRVSSVFTYTPDPGEILPEGDFQFAYWFGTGSKAFVTRVMIYLTYPGTFTGRIPDGTADPIKVLIRADDNGYPGEVLWESDPMTNTDDDPWVVVEPNIEVDGSGYWASYYSIDGAREAICFDQNGDWPIVTYWKGGDEYLTGGVWEPYQTNISYDPMVRSEALLMGGPTVEPTMTQLFGSSINANAEESEFSEVQAPELPKGFTLYQTDDAVLCKPTPRHTSGFTSMIPGMNIGQAGIQGYNLYYSLNGGDSYTKANDELITSDVGFINLGSEHEGETILVYATAVTDNGGSEVESDPSESWEIEYGIAPAQPEDFSVVSTDIDAGSVTLSWTASTLNYDETALTDLAGYRIYRSGEIAGEVGVGTTTFTDVPERTRFYQYWVVAIDDNGNESYVRGWEKEFAQAGYPEYYTSFETEANKVFEPLSEESEWEWGTPTAGPGAAYEGSNVWATTLDGNYTIPDFTTFQKLDTLVSMEPFKVNSPSAQVVLYNWLDYDTLQYPNVEHYRFFCSPDDGVTWFELRPENDLLSNTVNFAGITGSSGKWVTKIFDLSPFYVAGQETAVLIALQHFAFAMGSGNHYGVAVDAMHVFGVVAEPGAVGEVPATLPLTYSLHQNFPNPFNPTTTLRFDLVEAQPVHLTVYNSLGQKVQSLVSGTRYEAGYHQLQLDGSSMATGVYFLKLDTPAYSSVKKMLLMK